MESAKLFEILLTYNRFWSGERVDAGVEHDVFGPIVRQLSGKEVIVLKGVRCSGKSTLMDQIIRHLLAGGAEPHQILRVNLEEPLLALTYCFPLPLESAL
ncbi:MAG: AAA family ATPase [Desulfobia sp.]